MVGSLGSITIGCILCWMVVSNDVAIANEAWIGIESGWKRLASGPMGREDGVGGSSSSDEDSLRGFGGG